MKDKNGIELQEDDRVKYTDSHGDISLFIFKNGYLYDEKETDFSMKNAWTFSSYQIEKEARF